MVNRVIGHPARRSGPVPAYRRPVISPARTGILRWILLCALTLGVVGMHHLMAPEPDDAATASPAGPSMSMGVEAHAVLSAPAEPMSGKHEMLHFCLAILVAAVAVLARLWFRCGRSMPWCSGISTNAACPARDPPRPPRSADFLSALCVLRL
jgi:Family of unknown function (DUF6153)